MDFFPRLANYNLANQSRSSISHANIHTSLAKFNLPIFSHIHQSAKLYSPPIFHAIIMVKSPFAFTCSSLKDCVCQLPLCRASKYTLLSVFLRFCAHIYRNKITELQWRHCFMRDCIVALSRLKFCQQLYATSTSPNNMVLFAI